MKKQTDTWLGFFKRTLKITGTIGLLLILTIVIFIIYMFKHETTDSKTYLNCEESYYAFIEYNGGGRLSFTWDSVETKFKYEHKLTKSNKQILEAEIYTADSKTGFPSILTFDRVKGTLTFIKNKNSEPLFVYTCKKISKDQLPKKEIKQKF